MAVGETVSCIKELKQHAFLTEPEKWPFVTADACYQLPASCKICPIVGGNQLRLQRRSESIPEASRAGPSPWGTGLL